MVNWDESLYLEHRVAQIISQQEINGWYFDVDLAHQHVEYLDNKCDKLYEEITHDFGSVKDTKKRTCTRPFAKEGGYSAKVSKLLSKDGEDLPIAGPFTYIKGFLSEKSWVVENLLSRGWSPRDFTDTGLPQLTIEGSPVESLLEMDNSIGLSLSKWMSYNKHRGTILNRTNSNKGWLNHVREDHRISALANSCGTNTGRMRHRVVVNVPKASVLFGKEMRSLFTVPEGKVLVGHDASGLEARVFGHYINDPDLIHELIHGDFHTKVWEPIKDFIDSRDNAKNIEYALLYGASNKKLGSMSQNRPRGWSDMRVGKAIRELIMRGIPALDDLTKRVQKASERGFLIGLDGRKLYTRSSHSALNVLFQGAGAIIMKKSLVLLDDWIKEEGWGLDEAMKVGDFHDEGANEVIDDKVIIDKFCNLAVNSIVKSGEYFNFRCPLDAEAMVGKTWAQTH